MDRAVTFQKFNGHLEGMAITLFSWTPTSHGQVDISVILKTFMDTFAAWTDHYFFQKLHEHPREMVISLLV